MSAPVREHSWSGTSLLDQVLAHTLDPAYATAAEARAGRPAPGARSWGRVAVALVMVVAGLLATTAYNLTVGGKEGREVIRAALISDISDSQQSADELGDELAQAAGDVAGARNAALEVSVEGRAALDRLDAAEQLTGALPVSGPGLLVTLGDAEPDTDSDPVGGEVEADPRGQVRDRDLQLVVNALWAAGAEAVSINGQRLGPTTAIRFAGEAVLVDFRPVTSPYEISAIGDPDGLSPAFLTNPDVQALAGISDSFGLRFDFARKGDLHLPAAGPPDLSYATTPEAADDDTAADTAGVTAADPPAGSTGEEGS